MKKCLPQGIGNYSTCGNRNLEPSRISTINSFKGPGAYASCNLNASNGEAFDSTAAKYFMYHPDLKWVRANGASADSIPGLVTVNTVQGYPSSVGRVNIVLPNVTYQSIGKFYNKLFYYNRPGTEISIAGNFEVLVCNNCTNGGIGRFKSI